MLEKDGQAVCLLQCWKWIVQRFACDVDWHWYVQSGVTEESRIISFQSHSQDVICSISNHLLSGRYHLNRLQKSKMTRSIQANCDNFEKTFNGFVVRECDGIVIGARCIRSRVIGRAIPWNLFGVINGILSSVLQNSQKIIQCASRNEKKWNARHIIS